MKAKKWTKLEAVLVVLTLLFLAGTGAAYGAREAERERAGYEIQNEGAEAIVAVLESAVSETEKPAPPEEPPAPEESKPEKPEPPAEKTPPADSGCIDLNTATAEELNTLPGIGEVLAERIVAWREENGGFYAPTDLMRVKGIGRGIYSGLEDLVTVGEK